MKEQHFDKLFREQLSGFTQAPPPGTIDKINHQLRQRHQKVWIKFSRLAATLALIALSVYLFSIRSHQENINPAPLITVNQPEIPVHPPELPDVIAKSEVIEANKPLAGDEPSKKGKTNELAKHKIVDHPKQLETEIRHQELAAVETEEQVVSHATDNQETVKKPEQSKVTITYKKGPDPAAATLAANQEPNSKSRNIRKILKTAQQVDYNSFSLAGIRATKDQLLAINKKDKNKETKPD